MGKTGRIIRNFAGVILLVWLSYIIGRYAIAPIILMLGITAVLIIAIFYYLEYINKSRGVIYMVILGLVFFLTWVSPLLSPKPKLRVNNQTELDMVFHIYNLSKINRYKNLSQSNRKTLPAGTEKRIELPVGRGVVLDEQKGFIITGTETEGEVIFQKKIVFTHEEKFSKKLNIVINKEDTIETLKTRRGRGIIIRSSE